MFTCDLKAWLVVFSVPQAHQHNSPGEGVPGGNLGSNDTSHGFSKGSSDLSERPGLATSRKWEAFGCVQFVIQVRKLLK